MYCYTMFDKILWISFFMWLGEIAEHLEIYFIRDLMKRVLSLVL